MPENAHLRRFLPFYDDLSGPERETLHANTRRFQFAKGQLLRGDGDCAGVLLIEQGELRCFLLSPEGREITLYRLHPGEICVLSASCLLTSITFEVHMVAENETTAWVLDNRYFAGLMERDLRVENFSLRLAAERFSDVMWAMQQLLFLRFDQRLASFLLSECQSTGGSRLLLTHEQIARYIGSAREVVTRMLREFQDRGLVRLGRGAVTVLSTDGLHALAGE